MIYLLSKCRFALIIIFILSATNTYAEMHSNNIYRFIVDFPDNYHKRIYPESITLSPKYDNSGGTWFNISADKTGYYENKNDLFLDEFMAKEIIEVSSGSMKDMFGDYKFSIENRGETTTANKRTVYFSGKITPKKLFSKNYYFYSFRFNYKDVSCGVIYLIEESKTGELFNDFERIRKSVKFY